jgi:hypothetical protein
MRILNIIAFFIVLIVNYIIYAIWYILYYLAEPLLAINEKLTKVLVYLHENEKAHEND